MSVIISRPQTRRRKILYIGDSDVLGLVYANQLHHEYIKVPLAAGLPEDVEVHGVYYDPHYSAFCFMLSHESFDEVGPGCVPEAIQVEWKVEHVERVKTNSQPIRFLIVTGMEAVFVETFECYLRQRFPDAAFERKGGELWINAPTNVCHKAADAVGPFRAGWKSSLDYLERQMIEGHNK